MIVCIAEKPSVAGEIAKILGATARKDGYFEGNGYQVTWTYGHLCQLKSPDGYRSDWKRWAVDVLPMIPSQYDIELIDSAHVKKQFKIVKTLFSKATEIINCGDAGQEGELIQRWVMQKAGVRCSVKRLWISSLTEESIRQGFRDLRPQQQYDSLYMAGLARAEGDWLLGMNCTRLYTLKYGQYKQVLSIGRVQTPTLAMIVARDSEIENFVPQPYWLLTTKYRNTIFSATAGKLQNRENGERLLTEARRSLLRITNIQEKKGSEQSPQLYDLTALQVDCNRKYGFSADKTLSTIQSLYEKKLTTYPRVDTKYLPDDQYAKVPDIMKGIGVLQDYSSYVMRLQDGRPLLKSKRVFDGSKVTDHHAIIPTGDIRNAQGIDDSERKVFDLIVRRFLAAFYPSSEYLQTTVMAAAGNVEFKATGRLITEEGWRSLYTAVKEDDDDEKKEVEPDENAVLPRFTIGESGAHYPELVQKMTTSPARFNEASLLQAMETAGKLVDDEQLREAMKENGIGRPSSRASIIETLLKRNYIRRNKKQLISNPAGRELIAIIQDRMLKSPEMTGQWERKLRDIERGKYSLEWFMKDLEKQLIDIIKTVHADHSGRRVSAKTSGVRHQ